MDNLSFLLVYVHVCVNTGLGARSNEMLL